MTFSLSAEPIEPGLLRMALEDAGSGACVVFEGWVRNRNDGRSVRALEYEVYQDLAEKEGRRILEEARARFSVTGIHAVHRSGTLQIGELAVWVGVTAEHRGDAFEACRYVIDEMKARVPIWKKEHYADGETQWINCATRGDFA